MPKIGKDLQSLAAEIERQAKTKKDYVASTAIVEVTPEPNGLTIDLHDKGAFTVGDIAHGQIAEFTKIPKPYYDRMRTNAPELLATNVAAWFKRDPKPRLWRTLDGKNRAMLSDGFQTFDNYDFGHAALPLLLNRKLNIVSCDITETNLYIKAVDEQIFTDVPVGYKMGDGSHKLFDTCAPAIILKNSEVGFGRLVVETGVYTKACTNLCWFAKDGFRRTHVGARHRMTENIDVADLDAIMSNATKKKTMEALWLQVRDVIASAFDKATVAKRIEKLEAANGRKIEAKNVEAVMEVVQERFGFSEDERGSIFQHLIGGGNLSQYGLHSAITRAAQDVASYDRATELEYIGGQVIELAPSEFATLAEAA